MNLDGFSTAEKKNHDTLYTGDVGSHRLVRELEDVQLQKTWMEYLFFSIYYICIVWPVNGSFAPYTKKDIL
jgi:hypothetical protein